MTKTPAVDLKVTVIDSPDPVVADSNLQYVVTVANTGLTLAPNVKANVAIPDETYFVAAGTSSECVRIGTTRNVECSFGNIAPGDNAAKQITVRPSGKISPVTFDVNVNSDLADANTTDNSAKEKTNVGANTPPPNDNFLKATQLVGMSGAVAGTNVGATREIPINYGLGRKEAYELNHGNINGGKSVWYFWTPPANSKGQMVLDTQGQQLRHGAGSLRNSEGPLGPFDTEGVGVNDDIRSRHSIWNLQQTCIFNLIQSTSITLSLTVTRVQPATSRSIGRRG